MPKLETVQAEPTRRKVITTREELVAATEETPDTKQWGTLTEFMHAVSERGWEKCVVYLYRRRAEDARRLGAHLAKLSAPVSEDETKEKRGGGSFRALANGGGPVFASCGLEIEGASKFA